MTRPSSCSGGLRGQPQERPCRVHVDGRCSEEQIMEKVETLAYVWGSAFVETARARVQAPNVAFSMSHSTSEDPRKGIDRLETQIRLRMVHEQKCCSGRSRM